MNRRIPFWVDLTQVPMDERDAMQTAADRAGADRILDGPSSDLTQITLDGPEDQEAAESAEGTVVVDGTDWTIIPLENLIAARRDRPGSLFAVARSPQEAGRFRHVLDVGVHGIVLRPKAPEDIIATAQILADAGPRDDDQATIQSPQVGLVPATVTRIEDAGRGERVCVDCTERFRAGEGLLVGSTAASFILVHAETIETPYVNARPFRVNAGAVHSYMLAPGDQTAYLSEVAAGTKVLAVHADGATRTMTVGRAKIEHRPHSLVVWESEAGGQGSAVVQLAETIRFIRPDGSAVAVTDLQVSDEVLVYDADAARHMGRPVQERLREQ